MNTKNRDGFNEMLRDAMDGKIDLIVTKSVSRFARNTLDSKGAISWDAFQDTLQPPERFCNVFPYGAKVFPNRG